MSRSLSAILAAVLALAGPRSTQASPWLRAPKAPVPIDGWDGVSNRVESQGGR